MSRKGSGGLVLAMPRSVRAKLPRVSDTFRACLARARERVLRREQAQGAQEEEAKEPVCETENGA